jgi:hypothetical protein
MWTLEHHIVDVVHNWALTYSTLKKSTKNASKHYIKNKIIYKDENSSFGGTLITKHLIYLLGYGVKIIIFSILGWKIYSTFYLLEFISSLFYMYFIPYCK